MQLKDLGNLSNVKNIISGTSDFANISKEVSKLGESSKIAALATTALSKEEKTNILITQGMKAEQAKTAVASMKMAGAEGTAAVATGTLGTAFKGLSETIKGFLTTNPVGWILLAAGSIAGVVTAIDSFTDSAEEAKERIDSAKENLQSATDELSSLQSELDSTKKKIEEIQSKGKLSFTDEEELDNLKKQNDELERTIELQNKKKKYASNSVISEINNSYDSYRSNYGNMDSYKNEIDAYNDYIKSTRDAINTADLYFDGNDLLDYIDEKQLEIDNWSKKSDELKDKYLTYAQQLEEWIGTYEKNGIDSLTSSQKNTYDKMVSDLNNIYNNVLDKDEYFKFQIKPIFSKDEFKDVYGEIVSYLSSGGSSDISALKMKFGNDIINALQSAIKDRGLDFEGVMNGLYNDQMIKFAPIVKANNSSDSKLNDLSMLKREWYRNLGINEQDAIISGKIKLSIDDSLESCKLKLEKWKKENVENETVEIDLSAVFKNSGSIDKFYAELKQKISDNTSLVFDYEDVEKLRTELGLTSKEYDKYAKVLESSTSSEKDMQNALTKMLNAYIYQSGILNNITTGNYKMIASQLELQGITNASSIITEDLAKACEYAKNAGIDLTNVTFEEIGGIKAQAKAAGIDISALAQLELAKLRVNNAQINTSGDIDHVIALANAAGASVNELERLARAKKAIDSGNYYMGEYGKKVAKNYINNNSFKLNSSNFKVSSRNPSGSNGSKSGSSKSTKNSFNKEYYNIERKISNLQDKVDEKLNSISERSSYTTKKNAHKTAITYYDNLVSSYKSGKKYYQKKMKSIKFSSSERKTLNSIVNGSISIKDIKNEGLANRIDQYMSLSDKVKNCTKGITESTKAIKDQNKALQELDLETYNKKIDTYEYNIEKAQKSVSLKETKGLYISKSDYDTLISNSKNENKELSNANKLLYKKLKGLSKTSDEYKDISDKIRDNANKIRENQINQEEWNNAIKELPITKLQDQLDLLDKIGQRIKSEFDLKKAIGDETFKEDYTKQIDENQKLINKNEELATNYLNNYMNALKASNGTYGGKSKDYWSSMYNDTKTAINNIKISNEELKDSLRDDVYWRSFDKAHEECIKLKDELSAISDLIGDTNLFDDKGALTNSGITKASIYVKGFENAKKEVENYQNDLKELNKMYLEGQYSSKEYNSKLKELQQGLVESAKDAKTYKDSLVELYKNQGQAQLDSIKKVIDARQKAIDKQKEYYDYGRQMASKSKEINNIKQEINALESLSNAQDKAIQAKIKSLNLQLKEKEDDYADAENEHKISIITDGLNDFSDSLQDTYDDHIKDLESNLDQVGQVITDFKDMFKDSFDEIAESIDNTLKMYGFVDNPDNNKKQNALDELTKNVREMVNMLPELNKNKDKVGLSLSGVLAGFPNGGLVERVKANGDDGIASLKVGENVMNQALTNLVKNNLPVLDDITKNIANIKSIPINSTPTIVNNYDNLINVEGNVDKDALPGLEEIVKKAFEYTEKQKDTQLRKRGYKK